MKLTYRAVTTALLVLIYYGLSSLVNGQCLTSSGDNEEASASSDLLHVTQFSLNLFKHLVENEPGKNLFLSPYGIWNSLALAYLGSQGETKEELQKVLGTQGKVPTLKTWRSLNYL